MKKTIFAVSLLVVFGSIFSFYTMPSIETLIRDEVEIIIDAGHGEPDGGALASDGTKESDLNLVIAEKIYNLLTKNGIKCIMTRSDSSGIFDNGDTIHAKKVSDIRNRVKIAKNNPNAIVVSVHMNTFPSDKVSGAQVFYKNKSAVSKSIAEELQSSINQKIQPDNTKSIKTIPSNVYFFNHIENECVLIECGFLTNKSDLENLKNDEFQNCIAQIISEVIIFNLGE